MLYFVFYKETSDLSLLVDVINYCLHKEKSRSNSRNDLMIF